MADKISENKIIFGISAAAAIFALAAELFILKKGIFAGIYRAIAMAAMVPVAVKDYREHIIPNKYLLCILRAGVPVIILNLIIYHEHVIPILGDKLMGGAVAGGIFLIVFLISPKGLGAGDVKMYGTLGLLLGFNSIFSVMFFALLTGAVCSVIMLLTKKITRKAEMPMAPYTLAGLIIAMAMGA